ncbi:hypothetical protein K9N68_33880 [Kovacikia minuta CCNUW1]|uniref:hypothetical protein n=1 Tax=Kovacikia minuta TaxID=2931930 RepID=UPI001CCB8098|nr:hypothetical protein [Kovacikia minuta]UBF26432.1 hypothetical protein K9N68_33880 [Kovacikia minuta CCNUW1]
MLAFEVSINANRVCTAGIDDYGVLTSILTWVKRQPDILESDRFEELTLDVGGLLSNVNESLSWLKPEVSIGDSITIKIVDIEQVDEPFQRDREFFKEIEKRKRDYYNQMKKEYGD